MLNICDLDLLGRTLKDDKVTLSIGKYYQDRVVGDNEAASLITEAQIINMAGKNIVDLSLNLDIGIKSGVKSIDGVPFLLVFKT